MTPITQEWIRCWETSDSEVYKRGAAFIISLLSHAEAVKKLAQVLFLQISNANGALLKHQKEAFWNAYQTSLYSFSGCFRPDLFTQFIKDQLKKSKQDQTPKMNSQTIKKRPSDLFLVVKKPSAPPTEAIQREKSSSGLGSLNFSTLQEKIHLLRQQSNRFGKQIEDFRRNLESPSLL